MSIPSVADILTITHKHLGVPPEVIKDTKYRTPQVCQARGIAALVARQLTFLSFGQLEEGFELDRGTIAASSRKVEKEAKLNPVLQAQISSIIEEFSGANSHKRK